MAGIFLDTWSSTGMAGPRSLTENAPDCPYLTIVNSFLAMVGIVSNSALHAGFGLTLCSSCACFCSCCEFIYVASVASRKCFLGVTWVLTPSLLPVLQQLLCFGVGVVTYVFPLGYSTISCSLNLDLLWVSVLITIFPKGELRGALIYEIY